MAELEHDLRSLATELDWPETPTPALRLEPRRARDRRWWRPALIAVAVVALALAVALSVPGARSAILRVFHLGGATVERVDVLPPAREEPLGASLGRRVSAAEAARALGQPVRLPRVPGTPVLHLRAGAVSVLLAAPQPVLLSELRSGGFLLKKLAGMETNVAPLEVGRDPGLWITGRPHVVLMPAAPARLAGNVLLWEDGTALYRLEAPRLDRATALRLATEIQGP
ncbi:MAG TPA: hypothetical protein VF094_09185 [Gaiellaceae bacterium]